MLNHRSYKNCSGGFYTYNAFITAAKSFSGFGTIGNTETRKKEIAAFFAQTSQETKGRWNSTLKESYAWGYCFVEEQGYAPIDYCSVTRLWPCSPGKTYYGQGPFQILWNINYGPAGKAIGADLINYPELVATDPVISFKTALWFWMTPQPKKPSCHDVMTGRWKPSAADRAANCVPGFGAVTNIVDDVECGEGTDTLKLSGVSPGNNIVCDTQAPFTN